MKHIPTLFLALLALSSMPAMANLTYATGQDANHDGIDDVFTVNGAAAYLVTQSAGGWPVLPNAAITSGKYISWAADQSNATQGGVGALHYDYGFKFNWSGGAAPTTFDFRWISDDYLTDVVLNGVSLGVNNLGASQPWTISNSVAGVSGMLNSGINTIDFLVWNSGSGPTGLAADFTVHGDASLNVPEPGSLVLVAGALGALALRRRMVGKSPV